MDGREGFLERLRRLGIKTSECFFQGFPASQFSMASARRAFAFLRTWGNAVKMSAGIQFLSIRSNVHQSISIMAEASYGDISVCHFHSASENLQFPVAGRPHLLARFSRHDDAALRRASRMLDGITVH